LTRDAFKRPSAEGERRSRSEKRRLRGGPKRHEAESSRTTGLDHPGYHGGDYGNLVYVMWEYGRANPVSDA